MTTNDFWEKCVEYGVVIVAVNLYRNYDDKGDFSQENFIGIRYAVLDACSDTAIDKDGSIFVQVDDHCSDLDSLFLSPDEALDAAIRAS